MNEREGKKYCNKIVSEIEGAGYFGGTPTMLVRKGGKRRGKERKRKGKEKEKGKKRKRKEKKREEKKRKEKRKEKKEEKEKGRERGRKKKGRKKKEVTPHQFMYLPVRPAARGGVGCHLHLPVLQVFRPLVQDVSSIIDPSCIVHHYFLLVSERT